MSVAVTADEALLGLKVAFLVLLYLFVWLVVRSATRGLSAGAPQVLIRNVGFDAEFAQASRDHSRIVIRVPKDADKDRGEIRLLFGWAKRLK